MLEQRSLSKFGLSQIRMTFEDDVDLYRTRQLVSERLPCSGGEPKMTVDSTTQGWTSALRSAALLKDLRKENLHRFPGAFVRFLVVSGTL